MTSTTNKKINCPHCGKPIDINEMLAEAGKVTGRIGGLKTKQTQPKDYFSKLATKRNKEYWANRKADEKQKEDTKE